jgi:hypothetical protein
MFVHELHTVREALLLFPVFLCSWGDGMLSYQVYVTLLWTYQPIFFRKEHDYDAGKKIFCNKKQDSCVL